MIKKIFLALFFIVFFYVYVRHLERNNLYGPSRAIELNPSDISLQYEEIFFDAIDDVRLNGWFVPADNADITLIFAHGNGGNISHRLDKLKVFNDLGVNVFIFDYRGYGKSEGVPQESGLYKDITAAYDYIKSRKVSDRLVIYGESLGGAVAIDISSRVNVDGLILEGTFTKVSEMAKTIYPWLPGFFLKSKFDSISKIAGVKSPKLHLHGRFDNIVPFEMGQRLFVAAGEPKKFVTLEGQHNDGFYVSADKVQKELREFFNTLKKQSSH